MRVGLAVTFDELLCRRPEVSGAGGGGSMMSSVMSSVSDVPSSAAAMLEKSPSHAAAAGGDRLRHPPASGMKFNHLLCQRSEESGQSPPQQGSEASGTVGQSLPPSEPAAPQEPLKGILKKSPLDGDGLATNSVCSSSLPHVGKRPGSATTLASSCSHRSFPFRRQHLPMRNEKKDHAKCRRRSLPTLTESSAAGELPPGAKLRSAAPKPPPAAKPNASQKRRVVAGGDDDVNIFAAFLRNAASTETTVGRLENKQSDQTGWLRRQNKIEKMSRNPYSNEILFEIRTFYMGEAHDEMMKSLNRANVTRSTGVYKPSEIPEALEMGGLVKYWRKEMRIKTKEQEAKEKKEAEKKAKAEAERSNMLSFMGGLK